MINSRHMDWYRRIESALWRYFALFDDLCARCAAWTVAQVELGDRRGREDWCCCMIDNQVHDTWPSLNAVQSRFDRDWYEPLRRVERVRMPGNGPCPALGPRGCRLRSHRPITCTTQLCTKMLAVLKRLDLADVPVHAALQIEDVIALPAILPALYGTGGDRRVTPGEVDAYLAAVRDAAARFAAVPTAARRQAIDAVLPPGAGA